jgi:TolB-like protein/tRNA A-37 threonylcarbamoyl transferase component Bud32
MASTADRWRRLQALFYKALEMEPGARSTFLDENCGGDQELRKEIEGLLDASETPLDFLQKPVQDAAHQMIAEDGCRAIAPGRELTHYRVISLLGSGGMGEVYLAEDTHLKRKVALKMLKPELTRDERDLRRFEKEAHAASALNHPNILTIYEFGQVDGLRFIAAEFIEGRTLGERIRNGPLETTAAIEVAIQIASALDAAHACGIVHRDIKPDNVILRADGIVKVLDFGIAKLSERQIEETMRRAVSAHSEPGMVLGTAKYMSPEQARGQVVDGRSDVFSLGSVMYEMITGRAAFDGETTSDVIAAILKVDPTPPVDLVPDVPYEIERIMAKALRKDRETRYQSARDLLLDLQDFKKEAEFQSRLQGPARARPGRTGWGSPTPAPAKRAHWRLEQTRREQKTSLLTWLGLLAALLSVLAVIAYFSLRKSNAPPAGERLRTLAILPFRNLKQDPATDFLGLSLADEIITKLGHVGGLTVRPSSSVDKYRNQIIDPKQVASDLNVDTLLTGSFIKEGDDLRITTQLIDVKPDRILWREAINLKYDKLLTVQDRVSEQIIKGLELNLSPAEAENIQPEKPINSAAYEYYLRGIDLYSQSQFASAIEMLEKSTTIEPNYAPAWAHLGRAYTTHASLEFGGREEYMKAQAAYEKAMALNPSLVEPRIYMANLLTDTGRVEQAVPLLRSVLRDSPHNAEAHWELGYAYRFAGMLEESVKECELARQNNPQVKISSSALNSYLYLGEYEKFLQSLPAKDTVYILFYRGFGEYHVKNYEQAAKDFDRSYERDPSLLPADVGKALSDSIRHDNTSGLNLLRQTESKIEERGVTDAEAIYKLAQAFAVLGDKASALHMLRHSIGGGFFCYPYFIRDPLLQNIRDEPELQTLMNQARDRHQQFKSMFF